jgi:hypothetical protein
MAAVNYATQYQQALQQVFKVGLRFQAIYNTPNNRLVKWTGTKTINVPNITTGGMVDVNRDVVGGFTRRADNNWIPFTLEHDREFRTLVDPVDVDESNMALTISNITQVFNTEHKIPEMDKYAASKIHSEFIANGGTVDETALTTANVLTLFDQYMEEMDDAEVPTEGRIMYVTPQINTLIKNAEQLQRSMDITGQAQGANRSIRSLDEVTIVVVPSSRMKSAYDFTDGAVAATGAESINLILTHPGAFYAPQKYEFVDLDEPSAHTGGKYLYYERKYWDIFGISVKNAATKINQTVVV